MTDDERSVAKEAGKEAAKEVLLALGIDANNPREAQEDFIFLRQWRKGSTAMKGKIFGAVITVAIPAVLYGIWQAFKISLRN